MTWGIARMGTGGNSHGTEHLSGLDGLRGLAAVAVLFSHLKFYFDLPINHGIGNYGVFVFFVLSGFLMGHLYLLEPASARNLARYAGARVARVVPLYYLVVLVSWFIGRFIDPEFVFHLSDFDLLRQLLFLGSKYVFWTIAPEMQFYVVFAFLWWIVKCADSRKPYLLCCFVFASIVFFFTRTLWPGFVVFSKLHIFLFGVALAALRRLSIGSLEKRLVAALQAAALVMVAVLVVPFGSPALEHLVYPDLSHGDIKLSAYYDDFGKLGAMGFIVFAFSLPSSLMSRVFGSSPFKMLGAYSFTIYLLHEPVIYLVHSYMGGVSATLQILIILGLTFVVSATVYQVFERPALAAGRKIVADGVMELHRRLHRNRAPQGDGGAVVEAGGASNVGYPLKE